MVDHNHDEEEETEVIKNKVVNSMLQWIKVLLPILIGFVGWYIASIVAPLDARITNLENTHSSFIEHVAKSNSEHKHFLDTINGIEKNHRREMDTNRRDIDRLEGKVYGYE